MQVRIGDKVKVVGGSKEFWNGGAKIGDVVIVVKDGTNPDQYTQYGKAEIGFVKRMSSHFEKVTFAAEANPEVKVSGEIPEKKAEKKYRTYAIVTSDNELIDATTDRDDARQVKADFGGKKAGVRILVMEAVKEIR